MKKYSPHIPQPVFITFPSTVFTSGGRYAPNITYEPVIYVICVPYLVSS